MIQSQSGKTTNGLEYNQYWFNVETSPFTYYPNSNCGPPPNLGKGAKSTGRVTGITVPKNLDMNKKHNYIINLDFNIAGKASDWFCKPTPKSDWVPYTGWGGLITDAPGFTDNDDCLMKNFTILFSKLLENGYVLIHLSMIAEDTFFNQPCDSTEICDKCWTTNNSDKDYLQHLFNNIYTNTYPKPLENLKLEYNNMALLGYSVGTGAVSRYINEFPKLKTVDGGYPFPEIKVGIMIAGGSLWCYSRDCKDDVNCGNLPPSERKHFAPCEHPNLATNGCCPHDLSEPNYDNGVFPWSKHPPMVLAQSKNDNFADPLATTFYTNVMKKHGVPVLNSMTKGTVHGLGSQKQITDIVNWVNKYINKDRDKWRFKIFLAFSIILILVLLTIILLGFFHKISGKNFFIFIGITLFLILLAIGLYRGINK